MATLSIRRATKARLRDLLVAAAGEVGEMSIDVDFGFPREWERNQIYVGDANGEQDHHDIRPGRRFRDDNFRIDVWCWASQKNQSAEEAEVAAETMFGLLEDICAENWTLKDSEDSPLDGLQWAVITNVDGPQTGPGDEGYVSHIRAEVSCKALLK